MLHLTGRDATRRTRCTSSPLRTPTPTRCSLDGCACTTGDGIRSATEPIPGLGAFYDLVAAEARRPLEPEAARGLRHQLLARAGHDVVAALPAIDVPTLVCAGRHDDLAPLDNSEFLAEQIPGARLEVFDGGHLFLVQDRSAFPAIAEFLQPSTAP